MSRLREYTISNLEALSNFDECPPLFLQISEKTCLCYDFFKLADLLSSAEPNDEKFQEMEKTLNKIANDRFEDFFEFISNSVPEDFADLIRSHRAIIARIYSAA